MAQAEPKKSAAAAAWSGFHAPKIMIARARKPRPAVIPRSKVLEASIERKAPAAPASRPARVTLTRRIRMTSIPAVSAACGYSPMARVRSPHRVRKSR